MAFGVIDPKSDVHPSGTVVLDDGAATHELSSAKHTKDGNIVLIPQPTSDPRDPLSWSLWRRTLVCCVIFFGTIVNCAAVTPLLNAGEVDVALDLGVSVAAVTKLNGYLLLATGAFGPIASVLARKYGRRPVYLFASVAGVVGCIIGEVATNYATLLAARIVQGFAIAPYEALVVVTVGDLFFLHERGVRIAAIMFMLTGVNNGASIIAGAITSNLGWPFNFHILLPFAALQLVLCIFFAPETAYRRPIELRDPSAPIAVGQTSTTTEKDGLHLEVTKEEHCRSDPAFETESSIAPQHRSWKNDLKIFHGTFADESIVAMLARLFVVFGTNLVAFYTIVLSGVVLAWFVAVAVTAAIILSEPPYLLTAAGIGYMSTGPFLGGLLGTTMYAAVADRSALFMAHRNKGVYEPEFSLPTVLVGGAMAIAGLIGWGYGTVGGYSLYLLSFVWGLLIFGASVLAGATTKYALDAYQQYGVEIFMMNMVFKNFFFYGLTQYIVQWLITHGTIKVFNTMAGITGGLCLMTLPMYLFGKKYRGFWDRHNIVEMCGLEARH